MAVIVSAVICTAAALVDLASTRAAPRHAAATRSRFVTMLSTTTETGDAAWEAMHAQLVSFKAGRLAEALECAAGCASCAALLWILGGLGKSGGGDWKGGTANQ